MMTAAPHDWDVLPAVPRRQMTAADYQALPEDVCRAIEIVDGLAVMSPAPTRRHQRVVPLIWGALEAAGRPDWVAAVDVDLRIADVPLHNRRPDVVVYRRDLAEDALLRPADTLLVVEVVSPGSETTDRKTKPLVYAEAGIGHFWRVEFNGSVPVVYAYVRDDATGDYRSVGTFVGTIETELPLPVKIDLAEIS